MSTSRRVATLALFSALLVACGAPETAAPAGPGGSTTDPDEPVSSTPDPSASPAPGGPQQVVPRPGMADVRAVPWERARPAGEDALRVTYWSGVEPCYVLDHVDVAYLHHRVEVTLFEGHDPEQKDALCIEIALEKVVRVPLDQPLAGRKIVDGSR